VEKMTRRHEAFRTQFSLNGKEILCGFLTGFKNLFIAKVFISVEK
jgi:hypothetical protein